MRHNHIDLALEIDGQIVSAKVRHRDRRARAKNRDQARAEARQFKHEREYA